jgi:hypothetical protein
VEKTTYEIKAQVEMIAVLPRTLETSPETLKMGIADCTLFPVYGKDATQRKVWVATFVDMDEASAWIHSCKVFGRPIIGAVMAGEIKKESDGSEAETFNAMSIGTDRADPVQEPN